MEYARTLLLTTALAFGLLLTTTPAIDAEAAGPNPVVIMETSMGRIIVMLYPKDAPKTVENFLKYVDAGFYDNTLFHRVILEKKQMGRGDRTRPEDKSMGIVQGGGYTASMRKKRPLLPPIKNEAATGLINKSGTIAMARTGSPDSATSEFFFNMKDNPIFDYKYKVSKQGVGRFSSSSNIGYCAFGKILRGMDVVKKIQQVKTKSKGRMDDVPVQPVFLKKAYMAR